MAADQVTLRELLQDPIYKAWFAKPPRVPEMMVDRIRWRVYASPDGTKWLKSDFENFVPAFNFVAKNLREYHDLSLTCRNYAFNPPVVSYKVKTRVKGKLVIVRKKRYHAPVLTRVGHTWCTFCRRPTVFGYFMNHHAVGRVRTPYYLRCTICGIREVGIKHYQIPGEEE